MAEYMKNKGASLMRGLFFLRPHSANAAMPGRWANGVRRMAPSLGGQGRKSA